MRIIDTGNEIKCLSGDNHPQLKIGDKLYLVDDRQSTYEKIQEINDNTELTEKERSRKTVELALGKEAAAEILPDITVSGNINLSFFIMAAITGEEYEELKKAARERKN